MRTRGGRDAVPNDAACIEPACRIIGITRNPFLINVFSARLPYARIRCVSIFVCTHNVHACIESCMPAVLALVRPAC